MLKDNKVIKGNPFTYKLRTERLKLEKRWFIMNKLDIVNSCNQKKKFKKIW